MKPFRSLPGRFATALAALSFPSLALAHPGHDHADIPSVIRHPLSGLGHAAITIVVFGALGLAAWVLVQRARRSLRRQRA